LIIWPIPEDPHKKNLPLRKSLNLKSTNLTT
jgi:hypothetical protein